MPSTDSDSRTSQPEAPQTLEPGVHPATTYEFDYELPLDSCPLCGSIRIARFDHDFKGRLISRCSSCSLAFLNPRYTDASIDALYTGYQDAHLSADDVDPERYRRKRRELDAFAAVAPKGRCLSVGCGDGLEITVARDVGFDVEGFEIDADTARAVAEKFDVVTTSGDFLDAKFPGDGYQAIVCDQVLEHVKQPRMFLRRIFELLAPGGMAYIGVPNVGSISNRFKTFTGRVGLKKSSRRGKHYDTWHHINYFSPKSLRHGLEVECGFDVHGVWGCPDAGDSGLGYVLRHRYPLLDSSLMAFAERPAS